MRVTSGSPRGGTRPLGCLVGWGSAPGDRSRGWGGGVLADPGWAGSKAGRTSLPRTGGLPQDLAALVEGGAGAFEPVSQHALVQSRPRGRAHPPGRRVHWERQSHGRGSDTGRALRCGQQGPFFSFFFIHQNFSRIPYERSKWKGTGHGFPGVTLPRLCRAREARRRDLPGLGPPGMSSRAPSRRRGKRGPASRRCRDGHAGGSLCRTCTPGTLLSQTRCPGGRGGEVGVGG